MSKKFKIGVLVVIPLAVIVAAAIYLHGQNIQVLNPKGPIALQERNLIYTVLALSLFVVIPVFGATILFSLKYRESNPRRARYEPDWDHSRKIETVWWAFPTILIGVLSVITWRSTYQLAPYRPIASRTPTMTIQVVALDWKWLFIYPQQGIATVNYVNMPVKTPVDFDITADAPMNSFWIPQLGGQIYAMAGMTTNLNLLASVDGNFRGSSANISGVGFSGMNFIVHASPEASFTSWVKTVRETKDSVLNASSYDRLAAASKNNPLRAYSAVQPNIFYAILDKYTAPGSNQTITSSSAPVMGMQGMSM